MIKLIPKLPVKHLRVLFQILQDEWNGLKKAHAKYLAKAQALID